MQVRRSAPPLAASIARSKVAAAPRVVVAKAPTKPASASGWDRTSYLPKTDAPKLSKSESREAGRMIFAIAPEAAKAEADRVGDFFERFPSRGATQITFFHSYWAQHETFQKVPLQAYLYHATSPVDAQGQPKNALWRDYALAVSSGAPASEVEAAFLKAHIAEFKAVVKTPAFKQLYATATPHYRQVVEAYLDALTQFESDLAKGRDATQIGRFVFTDTMRWLMRRDVRDGGFMATFKGTAAMLNPFDPLSRRIWGTLGSIATSTIFDKSPDRPAPSAVVVSLSAAEAQRLSKLTGIPFKAGRQELTEAMLEGASVAEPERRERPKGPAKRYPLRLSDFTADQKLRHGVPMAGPDGVMSAREIEGVVANVQGRVRSQLIEEFFAKYPVPQAGIQVYSANMLSMNGVYGQSQMANTLADAIMPVDNDGKPKNRYWQAYADAYDRHKVTGAPSKEMLESLWFKAHMKDFEVVDTPEFQRQLDAFWKDAAKDKAFEPLAIYTRAMVGGRALFEKATRDQVSEESAFAGSLAHFAKTIVGSKTFPFWQQDLREAKGYLANRKDAPLDDRGLPTDATLFARAASGLQQMTGLRRVGIEGLKQTVFDRDDRKPVSAMVDLARVLTPEQLKQVDPKVIDFYKNPNGYDISAGIHLPEEGFGELVLGKLGPVASNLGDIPDRSEGFEGFPLETELYKDSAGRTHWDRYVVVDGERRKLFLARFEVEGQQLKETFKVNGVEVALYFDVVPHEGGVKLTLDHKKSSKLAGLSDIVFTTRPTATGLRTTGEYTCRQKASLVKGSVEMRMTPRAEAA